MHSAILLHIYGAVRYENVLRKLAYLTEVSLVAKAFCIGYCLTRNEAPGPSYT